MDFEKIIDMVLKVAGVLDGMFFIAYTIGQIIDYFRGKKR